MKTILLSLVLALSVLAQQPPLRPVKVTLTSSATDTYAGTATPTLSAYVTGQIILFTANTANTGAASINVDSVGALTIVKLGGGITTALADNDIRSGQAVMCQYDGTNCQMLSQLGNAASGGSSSITTLPGYGSATTTASGATSYFAFNTYNTTIAESSGELKVMTGGTIRNLVVKITTPNPSGTTLTCRVRKIAAASAWNSGGSDTAVTLTIPSSGAEGYYNSGATTDTIADGDRITMACTSAGGTSGAIRGYSLELVR